MQAEAYHFVVEGKTSQFTADAPTIIVPLEQLDVDVVKIKLYSGRTSSAESIKMCEAKFTTQKSLLYTERIVCGDLTVYTTLTHSDYKVQFTPMSKSSVKMGFQLVLGNEVNGKVYSVLVLPQQK